jgi:hypothetical protein
MFVIVNMKRVLHTEFANMSLSTECTIKNATKKKTITYYGTKFFSEAGPPRVIDSPSPPPVDTRLKVILVAGPLLKPVAQKLCK